MKKLLIILFILPSLLSEGQKLSDYLSYIGDPAGFDVPIILGSTNRKVNGALLGYSKVDTVTVSQGTTFDTMYFWKHGAKAFYKLLRVGTGGVTLPSQTGQSGKYLTTDGTNTSWGTVSGSAAWGGITGSLSSQADLVTALSGKANTSHSHAGTDITSGFIALARLGSGTPDASKFLRGDGTWQPDSANIPVDGTLNYGSGVLGINSNGAGASLYKSVGIASSSYSVADGIQMVLSNYTGGTCTVTLPSASSYPDRRITVKNISSNNVVIAGGYSGDPTTMVQYKSWTWQSISGVWYLVAST